ncbi:MAG TPA: glutamine synthetase family protein, partial [Thermomicrobiales bacterium]|nr:glutamine synthetase family protein [Thermomicrobiales bacterium]
MSTPHQDDASGALLERLARDEIDHLWVVYTDYNGRSQGKSVPRSRFASTAQHGITFARANLGHNLTDHAPDDTMFGADSGDFFAVPDPNAYLPYPLLPATGRAMCWMRQEGGEPWAGCPRTVLRRQIDAFAGRGLRLQAAFEPEGYLFQIAPDGGPVPAGTPGMFSVAALETQAELFHRISETLQAMGIEIEQIAPEWGPGQFEVNLRYSPPLRAADNLVALKDVVRALARQAGLTASFMPKPRETLGGCGLHVHLSLWSDRGESVTEGTDHPSGLSETAASFLAGILAHARALVGV